ncbi:hypothetical protein EWY21_00050 [Salmonella enterica subsp. enterica]|nr:hypothetical protein [Salmonella enterica subsp. enterica]
MKKQYYNYFDDFNEKFISYMLATIRIESYAYRQKLFFKPISEDISYDKAEVDYGSGPTASNRQRAILNHNTNIGDGYKYRGRGKHDYFNARLIINGYRDGIPDKANEFKDYAELFEVIINETI